MIQFAEKIPTSLKLMELPYGSTVERFLVSEFSYSESLITSVFCLVFCGNKVLFTQEKDIGHPDIDIPGGHVEQGETVVDAVKREVYEETGHTLLNPKLIAYDKIVVENPPENYFYPTPANYLLFYVAVCDSLELENKHGLWLALEDARNIDWVKNNRTLFEAAYQEARYLRGDFEKSFLDTYDETGTIFLSTQSYDTVHRQGLWHKGVHIWILNTDNQFIIQKRGPDVHTKPNILESSAAGHINHGSTAIETVINECHEEIGITVLADEIEYVGTIIDQFQEMNGIIQNNEFDEIYLIRKNIHLTDITLEKKEVSKVLCLDAKEYLERGIHNDPEVAHRPEEYHMLRAYLYGK